MAFTINPANYTFKKDEAVIIRYEGASIDYGYLYGVKGVINSTSGTSTTLTFPPIETLGTYTCYVGTYIGADWTKSNNFTITITDSTAPPTNNPPTISYFDGSGSSTGAYSVNYTISDADNDTMAVSLKVDNNSYFSLGSKTGGTYNYNGTGLSVGNHALTLRVSDGKSETTKSCSVTITDSQPTNNPPVIGSVKVSETNYSGGYVLTYTATDRDNDTLYHRLKVDSGSYVSINPSKSGDSYRYSGSGLTTGTHTGIIQVTDGKATVNSSSFSISIPERPTSVKAELKQAKDNYDAKHENLKRIIAEIIADNLYDEATEKTKYDNAFSEYAQALAKYEEVCNKAIENISKNNADAISEALRSEIQGNIDDVTEIANKVKDDLQGFTADGILSEAEKEAIRKSVLILKTEKKDIDAQYTSLYSNTDLTGTPKTELKTAYDNYVSRYNALDVEISRLLKLTTITESDRVSFNSAFDSHDTALAGYSQKANLAIDKIAEKKKDDAIDESNKYTNAQIKILDDKIVLKASMTEVDNKLQNYPTKTEMKSSIEISANGIKQEVSASVSTAKDEAIDSANQSTDNKLNHYPTRTEMKSSIEQSATEVKTTVSETYTTKGESGNLETRLQTQITQNARGITEKVDAGYVSQEITKSATSTVFRFSNTGNRNLLRNGGFENGIIHWNRNGTPNIMTNQSWQNYEGKSVLLSNVSFNEGIWQVFPTKVGKKYSYSFYAQAENGTWNVGVEGAITSTVDISPSDWRRYEGTFTATKTTYPFVCYSNGSGYNIYIDNVCVVEGDVPSMFCTHQSEIYEGNTKIDKDGIEILNGGLKLKNKKNQDVFLADANGNVTMGIYDSKFTISATGDRKTEMWCDYYDKFILQVPYTRVDGGIWIKRDTGATILSDLVKSNNEHYKIYIGDMQTPSIKTGDLYVTGNKNCLQSTQNYDERLVNAYETCEYYFGDIGDGVIKDGQCIVAIDDMFQECVNTNIAYHVFTQVYQGNITKIERKTTYFVVYGIDGTEFSWELKAKRIGYENDRLNLVDENKQERIDDLHSILDDEQNNDKCKLTEVESLLTDIYLEDLLLGGI